MNLTKLARQSILGLKPYPAPQTLEQVAQAIGLPQEQILKLDTAYNPYLPDFYPPEVWTEVDKLAYPDPHCLDLRRELEKYVGYPPEWLVCGNGSDELIELLIKAFVDPGESILLCPPTFPMYEIDARVQGVEVQKVLRDENFELNVDRIIPEIKPTTKVIFIDSPANPVGTVIRESDLKKLLNQNVFVVIDEAYYEFCEQEFAALVREYPNLVLLRTFSKWAGIAGLRVGYMIANPEIIDIILKVKQPYNVNSAAQELAVWALQNRELFLGSLRELLKTKDYYIQQMKKFEDMRIISGQGSYLTLQLKTSKADDLLEFLKVKGILLRKVTQPEIPNALRSNLAKKQDVDRIVEVVREFYSDQIPSRS
jgi:histidinol-phosphate aminotransferase